MVILAIIECCIAWWNPKS